MLAFDWLELTVKIGCNILPARMLCAEQPMVPDCLGTLPSTLCKVSALKEAFGYYVYDGTIFLKWGITPCRGARNLEISVNPERSILIGSSRRK